MLEHSVLMNAGFVRECVFTDDGLVARDGHPGDLYDTRHAVFRPARMTADQLESGYHWAYREFYRWLSIVRGAAAHDDLLAALRHAAYAAGWKKFEPLWDLVIRARRAGMMLPALEAIFSEFGRGACQARHLAITTFRRTREILSAPRRHRHGFCRSCVRDRAPSRA
jgi:hypothetical protein